MTENEEINDCIEERISVPIIVPASSLSFEPLCKLNEDKSQKDLQPSDFALLCVTIALLCVTFHSDENRGARIHCYKCGDREPKELARHTTKMSDSAEIIYPDRRDRHGQP